MGTFVIFAMLIAVGIYIVMTYNQLIRMIEAVANNMRQIDIQLDRRFKVFESLMSVVKKYMDYEQTTLKEVIALRSQAEQARKSGDEGQRQVAEDQISQIATQINAVFEQYPELKADQNAMQLQEEIVSTENRLAYAKQAYNDSIEIYNATRKSFFEAMVVSAFRAKLEKEFQYWQLSAEKAAAQEDYTVKF